MESFINIHTHHIPTHDVDVWTNVNLQQDANTFLQPNSLDRNKGKTTFSVGIHPWYLDAENYLHQIDKVSLLLKEANCIAIGEAGLDKGIETNWELQKEVFIRQIELSEQHNLPMILHSVKSFHEIIQIKQQLKPQMPWIFHGFNHRKSFYDLLVQNGCVISIGTAILNPKSILNTYISAIDLNSIFLETDDSTISIKSVYDQIKFLKSIELESLISILQNNFNKTFR